MEPEPDTRRRKLGCAQVNADADAAATAPRTQDLEQAPVAAGKVHHDTVIVGVRIGNEVV